MCDTPDGTRHVRAYPSRVGLTSAYEPNGRSAGEVDPWAEARGAVAAKAMFPPQAGQPATLWRITR